MAKYIFQTRYKNFWNELENEVKIHKKNNKHINFWYIMQLWKIHVKITPFMANFKKLKV